MAFQEKLIKLFHGYKKQDRGLKSESKEAKSYILIELYTIVSNINEVLDFSFAKSILS